MSVKWGSTVVTYVIILLIETALKRRTFVPLPESNSRPTANKVDSHASVAPSENKVTDKQPTRNTREREMDTRARGRNRDTETSPPRHWRKVPPPPGKYVEY